jgi:hypothetical protein
MPLFCLFLNHFKTRSMLTITYLPDGNILLNSDKIQALIANPSAYTKLKIDATINCCPELFTHTTLAPFIGWYL